MLVRDEDEVRVTSMVEGTSKGDGASVVGVEVAADSRPEEAGGIDGKPGGEVTESRST